MNRRDAARLLDIIDNRIKRYVNSLGRVETTWGEVAATDVPNKMVDVYLYGSATASEDFRIIGGAVPSVGTSVKVAIDKATGDRWVIEPIAAVASSAGDSLAHGDLTGVTADQHHNQEHAIDGSDHTTSETDTNMVLKPNGTGGVEWGAPASSGHTIKEAGTPLTARAGLNFGAGFDLTDDSGNDETDVALDLSEVTINSTIMIAFYFDGGGVTISTGVKGDLGPFPFACTITEWALLADATGSMVVDIWKDTYANFPPTNADTITGSEKPTISSSNKGQDTSLNSGNGWSISVGDILRFNVDSCSTITKAQLNLKTTRVV